MYVNYKPQGILEAINILNQLFLLIMLQIGNKNKKPKVLMEHISCLRRGVLERIYRLHQYSFRATWYHSQSGRLMHAIDDRDGLDRLSIRI